MSGPSHSLLEQIQGLIQRTYDLAVELDDLGRFVVGDDGFRRFYAGRTIEGAGDGTGQGARTLIRQQDGQVRVALYLPDAMVQRLERYPPQRGLRDANVDAFATLVEEVDHLLCIAEGVSSDRPWSLFELELHANVSKHLVLSRFAAGSRGTVDPRRRAWLRYHLFDKREFCADDPETRRRYEAATRWAVRFIDGLRRNETRRRLGLLREFHRRETAGKLRMIRRLASWRA